MTEKYVTMTELLHCREEVRADTAAIDQRLRVIENNTAQILEVMNAWNNARGFVKTVQAISRTVKVLTPIIIFVSLAWYAITHGGSLPARTDDKAPSEYPSHNEDTHK